MLQPIFITYKEHRRICGILEGRIEKQKEYISSLRTTSGKRQSLYEAVHQLVGYEKKCIVDIREGTASDLLVAALSYIDHEGKNNMDLCLTVVSENSIQYAVARLCTTYMECGTWIDEIETKEINKGYGTILMECFIDYCKRHKVQIIRGKLCSCDLADKQDNKHGERLLHFYRKYGFVISEADKKGERYISLKLNEAF